MEKNVSPCPCCGQLRPFPTEPGEWEYASTFTIFLGDPKWHRATIKLPAQDDRDGQEGLRIWENGEMIWWPAKCTWRKVE
jgi:hypothetical protein